MAAQALSAPAAPPGGASAFARRHWPLLVAILLWAAPVIATLAQRTWSSDRGAIGPLILVTGLWALTTEWRRHRDAARPGRTLWVVAGLIVAAIPYFVGRVTDIVFVQALALYLGGVTLVYAYGGAAMLVRQAFPLVYLLLFLPLPLTLVATATRGLKQWVADVSLSLMYHAGFDVAGNGALLYIDGYELLVEAACSGLNSIVGLAAVGLFYIYLRTDLRGWRAGVLAAMILPAAIIANLLRVLLLLLAVHWQGDAILATAWHDAAGLLMFAAALMVMIATDMAMSRLQAQAAR